MVPPVYVLSYKNSERRERITARFRRFDFEPHFVKEVGIDDPRTGGDRSYAIMYNHLDMIRHFVDHTDEPVGIFWEDDIYLKRNFKEDLERALQVQKTLAIDILNLGYLTTHRPIDHLENYPLIHQESGLSFHYYPDDLWGASMYSLERNHALYLLENLTPEKCSQKGVVFTSDWSITKIGKRALMYPILGLEEGYVETTHQGQVNFHRACSDYHYNPKLYV